MDSFTFITDLFFATTDSSPADEENKGTGTVAYCVVFAKEDIPTDEENRGTGTVAYCVVA